MIAVGFITVFLLNSLLSVFSSPVLQPYDRTFRNASEEIEADAVRQLIHRLIPKVANQFIIKVDYDFNDTDAFQISSENGSVTITGNRGYSVAAGLQQYLKFYCGCHISWSGNQLRLPEKLPLPTQPITNAFTDKYRYYQNVCTSSYSFVWWKWERWEREIDWMALNGINLALAFNAQEAVFYKVFKAMNFTDHDIGVFFTGPAFLAWNRMGNIQAWAGPLNENWHKYQVTLQHKILDRMRSFGMTPVLPAFSGRVVPSFKRNFPEADIAYLNRTWGNFNEPFGNVTFLQPTDPIFQRIQEDFLTSYIEEFGTDHIYNADLFNEMPPPSTDPAYLQSCSKAMYRSLSAIDPEAIWMLQGWMFYSDEELWQEDQARSFLRAVPLGKMLVLDLQSELNPQFTRLKSYYGQPFIWCMLHNYGGVEGLYGSLDQVNVGPSEGRNFHGSTMVGTGITPEGIETNDIVYELMNEVGLLQTPTDLHEWLNDYQRRRYGNDSAFLDLALLYLRKSVYNASAPYRNHGKYILIRRPSLKLKPYIWYDPKDVFIAWSLFMNETENPQYFESQLYKHDLIDIGRQSLQQIMDVLYAKAVKAFKRSKKEAFQKSAENILSLYDDLEELLSSDEHFLLGRWLSDAKSLGSTPLEKRQYEFNARNQITLWGPSGEILDYANKQWAGLISGYYKKRWQLFFDTLENCLANKTAFVQSDFNKDVFQNVEYLFTIGDEVYPTKPQGDPLMISRKLYTKYQKFVL